MTFPKFTVPNVRIAVEILLVILVVILIFRNPGCGKPAIVTERGSADSTIFWKNKYGEAISSNKGTAEQFALQDKRIERMLDSIAKRFDTKANRIQEVLVATVKGTSHVKPTKDPVLIGRDTVTLPGNCPPGVTWLQKDFRSPYYAAQARIYTFNGDSSFLNIQSIDTFTYVWKEVREGGIFNRKKYLQVDGKVANPDLTITGMTAFRRMEKIRQVSIGPEVDILYLDRTIRPLAGVFLQRETNRWSGSVSGGKDFTDNVNIKSNPWYVKARLAFKVIKL